MNFSILEHHFFDVLFADPGPRITFFLTHSIWLVSRILRMYLCSLMYWDDRSHLDVWIKLYDVCVCYLFMSEINEQLGFEKN